jgi:6-phosphogluconolactonase
LSGANPYAVYVSCADDNAISVFRMDRENGTLKEVAGAAVGGSGEPAQMSIPLAVSPDRRFLYAALRAPPYPMSTYAIDPATGVLACRAIAAREDPALGVKTDRTFIVTDKTGRWLLAAAPHGEKIAVNAIGPDGLIQTPATILPSVRMIHSLRTDAANRFVYALALSADHIFRFRFDADNGTLTEIEPVPVEPPKLGPRFMAFHPIGAFLYVITEMGATIIVFAIAPADGGLRAIQSVDLVKASYAGKRHAADIKITPDGWFLYASERGTNKILAFRVDARSGTLTPTGSVEAEPAPRAMAIDPAGRFLLQAGTQTHRLAVFAIDGETGRLTRCAVVSTARNPNWIEVVDLPA